MSGFVARVELDGGLRSRRIVDAMAEAIGHRGKITERACSEHFADVASLDREDPGAEPGDFSVAADCRLDNRQELIVDLGLNGDGSDLSDAQLIGHVYRRWGPRCVDRLLGDFAFVVWDKKQQSLFAARDPMGVRPFYYHQRDDLLVAASEIAALKTDPELPLRLNEGKIADYLVSITTDRRSTCLADVFRLPPAHCLRFDANGLKTWRYWALDPERSLSIGDPADRVSTFAALFQQAVRRCMSGDRRVGSYLSGGLDSSAITAVASGLAKGRPWPTFSATFPSVPRSDERSYIDAVLAEGRYQPHFVYGHELDLLANLEEELPRDDDISPGYNTFINHALLKAVAASGVEIVLDGYDGDTTLSHGRRLIAQYLAEFEVAGLMRELSGLKATLGRPRWKSLWNYGMASLAPASWRMFWRQADGRNPLTGTRDWVINANFVRRVGLKERLATAANIRLRPTSNERLHHYLRLTNMNVQQLEHSGHTAAFCGVEQRYPFCDRQLVEFCLAMPGELKMRAGENRWICREALKGRLPDRVRCRRAKGTLAPNFDAALRRIPPGVVLSMIDRFKPRLASYLEIDRVQHICWDYFRNGESRDSGLVWKVLKLGRWLELSELQP